MSNRISLNARLWSDPATWLIRVFSLKHVIKYGAYLGYETPVFYMTEE